MKKDLKSFQGSFLYQVNIFNSASLILGVILLDAVIMHSFHANFYLPHLY